MTTFWKQFLKPIIVDRIQWLISFISSLVKTVFKSKTIYKSFWQIMPLNLVILKLANLWNINGFGTIHKVIALTKYLCIQIAAKRLPAEYPLAHQKNRKSLEKKLVIAQNAQKLQKNAEIAKNAHFCLMCTSHLSIYLSINIIKLVWLNGLIWSPVTGIYNLFELCHVYVKNLLSNYPQ